MIARLGQDGNLYDLATEQVIRVGVIDTKKEPRRRSLEEELDERISEINQTLMLHGVK